MTYARKKRPILLQEQDWESMPDITENLPEQEIIKQEEAGYVRQCLMCLAETERTILLLRDFEELSYEEISKIMDLSADVVKSRLYRARQKFRKIYETMQ